MKLESRQTQLCYLGLQNLPYEIDQNMQELRRMDEEFQRTIIFYAFFLKRKLSVLTKKIRF